MPFELPAVYSTTIESGKRKGEPKSKGTINVYKNRLNQIANATEVDTLEKIIAKPKKVIKFIKGVPPMANESDDAFRARIRTYYSAIFMILPPEVKNTSNMYYKANKQLQDVNPANYR
jgi:uncharacterized protein YlzI (FlbEa/FlbD family)